MSDCVVCIFNYVLMYIFLNRPHAVLTHLTLVLIRVWVHVWDNKYHVYMCHTKALGTAYQYICAYMCEFECIWVRVLEHTTSQNTHTSTKLFQPLLGSTCLNMKSFSFIPFTDWLFPCSFIFVFLSWGTWWSQILAQSAKNNTHTKKYPEKQTDGPAEMCFQGQK